MSRLERSPQTINEDPYEEAWMVRVEVADMPEGLMDAAAYEQFVQQKSPLT